MKKFLALSFVLVVMLSASAALADPVTLVYAEVNPLDTIVGQIGKAFKQRLKNFQAEKLKSTFRPAVFSEPKLRSLTEC